MAQTKIEQGLLKFTEATDYLKIPTGTTAQRPSSAQAGYIRFNTTISKFEIYDGTEWTEPGMTPPTVTSLDYPATKTALDPAGGETLLINGTNFQAGITVNFGGTAATSITINSSTQLSVVAPAKAAGNVTLTITNIDTGSVQTTVVYNALPTWTTAAGSLGSVAENGSISFTVAASEADSGAITYSVTSGSLPTGASLNSSTGAITGTAPSVSADTTYNFTITATDDENQTASRAFSITVNNILPSTSFGTILYEGDGTTSHSINGGKFGTAAYFNGTSSYIDFSNRVFNVPTNGTLSEFSISLWFYVESVQVNEFVSWWQTGTQTYLDGFLGLTTTGGNNIRFGDDWRTAYTFSNTSEFLNKWVHLVAIKTSTNAYIYLDGQLKSTKGSALNWGFNNNLAIGRQHTAGEYLDGKLDQLRLFQKALSSSEVTTLYNETASTVESLDPLSEDTTGTLQVLGDSSCLAAYQFENDETDLSGNYNGTPTKIQYETGRYGQAASFNGGSSYITIPSSTNPLGFINNNFSYSLWVNVTSGGEDDIIGNWDTGTASNNHFLMIFNGKLRMHLKGAGVGDSAGSISTNLWYHIVCTTDWTNGQFKYYINGSLDSTKTISTTAHSVSAANNLYIGTRSGGSPNFGGRIDQVRIFNKVLSAAEVTTLYNENSLVASYRFEGNAEDDTRNYDGTASNVTYEYGLNFTPDFVWIKNRSQAIDHGLYDSSRGATKYLSSNTTGAEGTYSTVLTSFDTGGFTVGNNNGVNYDGNDFVAWCLKANGGTTSSNTDGSVTTTVQVNETAGFSIMNWTGPFNSGNTFGHGLTQAPEFVIMKQRNVVNSWWTWHKDLGSYILRLDNTEAKTTTLPGVTATSTTITTSWTSSNYDWLVYCFHSVGGFSKFGSYTGNGSTAGPIVETGFEPAFLMIKRTDTANDWRIFDNKRNLTNPIKNGIKANTNEAESTGTAVTWNFYSNGFQPTTGHAGHNASGGTYIYMAFAADPDTVVPTKAKSFSTVTYTGNSSTQSIGGLGFSPNLVWIKGRNNTYVHGLYDTIRGPLYRLRSNGTQANELVSAGTTGADSLSSFDSDGFTLGSDIGQNQSANNYVAWAWKADDNEPTINTDGSIDSLVSANANAGFSIVKYDGNGTSGATIGHGLSAAPEMVIVKILNTVDDWTVYHSALGNTQRIFLNQTSATGTNVNMWNSTSPSSTTVTLGNDVNVNGSGNNYIAYCFHSVSGYSKIGTYTGNASTNAITGLGFQPDWILARRTDTTDNWAIIDSVREAYLLANLTDTEATYNWFAFTSDGFTLSTSTLNASGGTYIYAAFKIN